MTKESFFITFRNIGKIIWLLFGIFIFLYTLYWFYVTNHNPESEIIFALFTAGYTLPLGIFVGQIFEVLIWLFPIVQEISYNQIIIQWLITMILSYIQWFIVLPFIYKMIFERDRNNKE